MKTVSIQYPQGNSFMWRTSGPVIWEGNRVSFRDDEHNWRVTIWPGGATLVVLDYGSVEENQPVVGSGAGSREAGSREVERLKAALRPKSEP